MDFEKYKNYLDNPWAVEHRDKYTTRFLTGDGWTMFMDEVFSPLIEKELGMRYMGNRVWADEYSCHRRRVLSLFLRSTLGGSFKWGWNFDFVPRITGAKAVYARTDKTIFTHFFENCHYNHDDSVTEKPELFFARDHVDIADFENSMQKMVDQHVGAFYATLPRIKTFYAETETYEQTVKMVDTLLQSMYYALVEGGQLWMTSYFLQQYIGVGEDNEKHLGEMFASVVTRESVLKKFAKIPNHYK